MAYLGNAPARSFISFERQVFTIVNSQTAYTLSHSVTNENDIRLVVNNIVQEPGSGKAYTASGTTLTLSAALTNGTDEMYCVFLGRAVATNKPGAGSVGTTELAADAVTEAKIADDAVENEHLNVNVITGQTAETSIATDDTILIHDTSASALKKMTRANFVSGLGGLTEADMWNKRDSDQTISAGTTTTVTGWSRVSGTGYAKIGTGLSESSGVFSFGATGIYLINCGITFGDPDSNNYLNNQIHVTTNNSSYGVVSQQSTFFPSSGSGRPSSAFNQYILDVTDTSNVKFKIRVFGQNAFTIDIDTDRASTFVSAIKLGDT
jgi:hypothetical protein